MESTRRLMLPLLIGGQLDKETYHNEALQRLDLTVAACVEAVGRDDEPSAPEVGQCWIVGSSPSGAFAGHAGELAGYSAGGWRFVAPVVGMTVIDRPSGQTAQFGDAGWSLGTVHASRIAVGGVQVLGAQTAPIPDVTGGTVVDAQARGAIAAMLNAMRVHGLIAPGA